MRKVLYILGLLTDQDIDWLIRHGRRRRFADGDVLISEGEPTEAMYIVLEGAVSVFVEGVGVVAERGVGELVGEMSFVDSHPPSATVSVKGTALTLSLDKEELQEELRANTAFASRFYRALAMFLSDGLRQSNIRSIPSRSQGLDDARFVKDELDLNVLDSVSEAGETFNRMIRRLAEG